MPEQIEIIGYLVCAAAFLPLGILVFLSRAQKRYKVLILLCSGTTMVWAGVIGASPWIGPSTLFIVLLELARDVAWLTFIVMLLKTAMGPGKFNAGFVILAILSAAALVLGVYLTAGLSLPDPIIRGAGKLSGGGHVLLAVIGLLLLENLFRNGGEEIRWATKHICFGLGAVFAFDFFLYADAALFNRIDQTLFQARGYINALAMPLIAVSVSRARTWGLDIHVSRKVIFHSAALVGTGLYLLIMAGAGYYLRQFGGEWGGILQTIFLFGALLILLVLFSSQAMRAKVKVWINKNFYSHTYDYREEWIRFTRTISADDQGADLHERILRAVADIVGRTAGALWILREEDRAYLPSAQWNFRGGLPDEILPAVSRDSPFISYLENNPWIIDMQQYEDDPDHYSGLDLPGWVREHPRADLVVPLVHREEMCAFLILGAPRAYQPLNWETYDLLKAVGGQAASYLKEEQAVNALSDARRLESFNRRFAFIIHDIKNLVSQMSLMLRNAERHGSDPEFQKDLLATVSNSVVRLTDLLGQFKADSSQASSNAGLIESAGKGEDEADKASLPSVVSRVAEAWRRQRTGLVVEVPSNPMHVTVDESKLRSVLDHLLQNAYEAAGDDGHISLRLKAEGDDVIMEVEDDGPGMDAEYIRQQLFRPLNTKKEGGYGLGAFQARELVRELGGRLEVSSIPGTGTVMQVILPARSTRDRTMA